MRDDLKVSKISENISHLKSKQDHHDQLPGLFPPGSEKTSVANAGGNWVMIYSGMRPQVERGKIRYFWGVTHTLVIVELGDESIPLGVGGVLQSEDGGAGGGMAATLASLSTREGSSTAFEGSTVCLFLSLLLDA